MDLKPAMRRYEAPLCNRLASVVDRASAPPPQDAAERIARESRRRHYSPSCLPFDAYDLQALADETLVVFVVATTGQVRCVCAIWLQTSIRACRASPLATCAPRGACCCAKASRPPPLLACEWPSSASETLVRVKSTCTIRLHPAHHRLRPVQRDGQEARPAPHRPRRTTAAA